MRSRILLVLLVVPTSFAATSSAQPPGRRPDPFRVHDPATIVHEGGGYFVFATGRGLPLFKENAERRFEAIGRLFERDGFPDWHKTSVPANDGSLWAPDIIKLGDTYYLYYSVSTIGKQHSAIGLVTGKSIDPQSADWKWTDRGPVIESREGDDYNTIDPAIFLDPTTKRLWMVYGSFWKGIHIFELDPKTGLRLHPDQPPVRLAWNNKIEAAFICYHDGYYYLMVNWGDCCRGVDSTYEIRIGRSKEVTGPYVDKDGKDLADGGGTLFLATEGRYIGPGHAATIERDGQQMLEYHYYDGENEGAARVRLRPLVWGAEGWPSVE